jgi:hypothetical protein
MKYGQNLKLGDAHIIPRNIQEVQASKLGDAPRHPFFIGKNPVIFQDNIFLLLHILCIFLGASLLSLSALFSFVCCNKWLDHIMFALERVTLCFHCQEHSSFHSYRFNECSLFLVLRLAFVFCLDFCSELVIYLYQGVFIPLVYVGFYLKRVVPKWLNGVGKEKKVSCL